MLNRNFLRITAVSIFIFSAILFHTTKAFGQCDAFVNGCNLGSVTQWTVNDTIVSSTGQVGEPVAHSFYTTAQNPLQTNWYHWTAPQNGMVVVNTQGTNPNAAPPNYQTPYVMDTVIAAYTGATLATLVRKDESDDWNPSNPPNCSCTFNRTLPEAYWSSCMMFPVTAGTLYRFQIDHLSETNPANNDFVLNLYYRVPTSSEVSIGGRVTDGDGNALGKVRINLTKPNGEVLSAISNPFGYYLIEGAEVGQTYTLEAQRKGVQFQNNPRVLLNVIDDLRGEDFIAETANVKKLE
jgi:hypothetical protein